MDFPGYVLQSSQLNSTTFPRIINLKTPKHHPRPQNPTPLPPIENRAVGTTAPPSHFLSLSLSLSPESARSRAHLYERNQNQRRFKNIFSFYIPVHPAARSGGNASIYKTGDDTAGRLFRLFQRRNYRFSKTREPYSAKVTHKTSNKRYQCSKRLFFPKTPKTKEKKQRAHFHRSRGEGGGRGKTPERERALAREEGGGRRVRLWALALHGLRSCCCCLLLGGRKKTRARDSGRIPEGPRKRESAGLTCRFGWCARASFATCTAHR